MAREWYSRPINSGYTVVDGTTTGNYANGNPNTYVKTWMEYKVLQDATDISNNRSRIDVKLYSQVIDGGSSTGMSNTYTANNYGYVGYDNANKAYLSMAYDFNNFALNKFADATLTIPHNSDGTKTITLQGAFTTISGTWAITGGSASKSITLPTIARGTELTAVSNRYYGFASTFTLSRKSSGFREQVTMTSGSTTLTLKTTSTADANFSYTLNRSYTPNTASPSASTWTISVKTYNGSTLIETKTYSYSWEINTAGGDLSSYQPDVPMPTVQAYNDLVSALGTDTYVAGYSRVNVKAQKSDITCKYGATIVERYVAFYQHNVVSADQTDHISDRISTAGSLQWYYVVTDSRGCSTVRRGSVTFISSSAPTIDVKECYRGDSSGNANSSGTYIWAKITTSIDSLNNHNSVQVRKGQVSGMSAVNMSENTRVALASNTALVTNNYTVTFTVTDLLRTTTVTHSIPSEDIPLHIREGGKGVGIGAYCEGEGLISVGYQFSGAIKSKGDRIFGTCNLIDASSLEQGDWDGSNHSIRVHGRASVKASTTYTLSVSGCVIAGVVYLNSSGTMITFENSGNAPFTFTTPSGCVTLVPVFKNSDNSAIYVSNIYNLQLEKGSSASSYVPYAMDNVELTKRVTWKYRGEFVNTVSFDADDVELMIVPKAYGFTMQRAVYFISDLNTAQSPSNIVSAFQTATSYAWAAFYRSGNSIILQDKQVGSSWSVGNVKFYVYTRK